MEGGKQTGSKSNQMFGYTVRSSGPDGPVVVSIGLKCQEINAKSVIESTYFRISIKCGMQVIL